MRKLGRPTDQRRALLRNIVTSLVMNEKIQTTEAKAKEIRSVAEKLVTFAKRGDLHARRQAARFLLSPDAVKKLFDNYGPKYAERSGGYTRIVKLGLRRGDAAPIVLIEFV